jgi:hypothetical protein
VQGYEQTWDLLQLALDDIRYTRDEWAGARRFSLSRDDGANYAVLFVFTHNPNTYRPDEIRHTRHEFVVPVATYDQATWTRWVFERIKSIEVHETCESFLVADHEACVHCGAHDEPDGDHSCSCPQRDGDCDHSGPWMVRAYAPHHGNGEDPYVEWHLGTAQQAAKAPGED